MAAFSGKKYPVYKIQDLQGDNFGHETTETNRKTSMCNPRSGKKYLPVRISTANFYDPSSANSASGRKTMGLSSRKPIRNIHKLFESPKRTARKRLDNLYDCSKPKENFNPTTTKAQALSAKKLAPKTPVSVTSAKKSDTKTALFASGKNSRKSRLLPPGTITGSYVKGRNSLAPRNSLSKPINNRLTIMQKIPQTKRPSDVPEESPQPLESSYNSSNDAEILTSKAYIVKKLTEASKGFENEGLIKVDKETSPLTNPEDEEERLTYCCKCSKIINDSRPSNNAAETANNNVKVLINSKEICDQEILTNNENNKAEGGLQRPTVIVMQKETAPQLNVKNSDESPQVPVQDGSYSEILSLQPSANNSVVDESLLFKRTERACTRLENIEELKSGDDKTTQFIFQLITGTREVLVEQQRVLTNSISGSEKNLESMKLALKNVESQLNEYKILESRMKLEGSKDLDNEEFSLAVNNKLKKNLNPQSSEEDSESGEKTNRSKGNNKRRKSRKSLNVESRAEGERNNDLPEDLSTELNQEIENIENQPPQRRRSARLATKKADLSLPVEESTPVTGKKNARIQASKSKPCTPNMTTPIPARSARWGRRSERPLREYMVLKSAMKFLNTPDSRRYRIGSDEKVQIRESVDKTDQAIVSDKLLKELHDLYATP